MSKDKAKTVKMKFIADQYYVTAANKEVDQRTPLYRKDEICDVPEDMVPRWLKRGGVLVDEKASAKVEAKAPEASKEPVDGGSQKPDDDADDDKDKADSKPITQRGYGKR